MLLYCKRKTIEKNLLVFNLLFFLLRNSLLALDIFQKMEIRIWILFLFDYKNKYYAHN